MLLNLVKHLLTTWVADKESEEEVVAIRFQTKLAQLVPDLLHNHNYTKKSLTSDQSSLTEPTDGFVS